VDAIGLHRLAQIQAHIASHHDLLLELLSPDRGRGGVRGFQAMRATPSPNLSP
jgi:hypothetical protein